MAFQAWYNTLSPKWQAAVIGWQEEYKGNMVLILDWEEQLLHRENKLRQEISAKEEIIKHEQKKVDVKIAINPAVKAQQTELDALQANLLSQQRAYKQRREELREQLLAGIEAKLDGLMYNDRIKLESTERKINLLAEKVRVKTDPEATKYGSSKLLDAQIAVENLRIERANLRESAQVFEEFARQVRNTAAYAKWREDMDKQAEERAAKQEEAERKAMEKEEAEEIQRLKKYQEEYEHSDEDEDDEDE